MDSEYKDERFKPFYLHDKIICVDDDLLPSDDKIKGPPLKIGNKYKIKSLFSWDNRVNIYMQVEDDNGNLFTYKSTSFKPIVQHRNNSINEILS